jgi:hypothetical protein
MNLWEIPVAVAGGLLLVWGSLVIGLPDFIPVVGYADSAPSSSSPAWGPQDPARLRQLAYRNCEGLTAAVTAAV